MQSSGAEPQISVVIPSHNDRAQLARLLPVLVAGFTRHGIAYQIIVVANGGDDGSVAVCGQHGAVCLLHQEALTPADARNRGANRARGAWLAFLDADVEPLDSWFAAVRRLVDSNEDNIAVGWEVMVPPGAGWLPIAWQHVRMAAARTQRYINTGNLVMATALFHHARGFDSAKVAGEDADFGDRIIAAGGRHVFDAQLAAWHHGEPKGVRDFFRRQLFHSESLTELLSAPGAPLNVAILATLGALLVSVIGTPWMWSRATGVAITMMLTGPLVLTAMATAKAAAGWRSSIAPSEFPRMVAACIVMLSARTVGTLWRLRTWRS